MDVAIAGGHGQIARLLGRKLAGRGDRVVGLIRDASQADDLQTDGTEPVVLDMEEAGADDLVTHVRGCDAVVFAAGAGPGSGAPRKETVDYGAAVKLIDAAQRAGVSRYVMVSSMGAANPPQDDEVFSIYLRAKARADEALMSSGLDWTVVRPGRLTNDPETGLVHLGSRVPRGNIPRGDAAEVLLACLDDPQTVGHVFEVVGGETAIREALTHLTASTA